MKKRKQPEVKTTETRGSKGPDMFTKTVLKGITAGSKRNQVIGKPKS